jgi:hypothetical protein
VNIVGNMNKLDRDMKKPLGKHTTPERSILTSLEWTAEKAWWLGATMGDGHSDNRKGDREITFTSGDLDLVSKWARLAEVEDRVKIRASQKYWTASFGDIRLTEWLAGYGMAGRKGTKLIWPVDMPEELVVHFARGLWDTDGHIGKLANRAHKVDAIRVCFVNKSPAMAEGLIKFFPSLMRSVQIIKKGPYVGYEYAEARASGKRAVEFVKEVYLNAPEHLRCDRKYKTAVDFLAWLEANSKTCSSCDRPVIGDRKCKHCVRKKWEGVSCACGALSIVARGMCRACYAYAWGAAKRAQKKVDIGSLPRALVSWEGLKDHERELLVAQILEAYKGRAFPWEDIQGLKEDYVLAKITGGSVTVSGGVIGHVSQGGQRHCLGIHHHRLEAAYKNKKSVVEAFSDEPSLKRAILFQLQHNDPVTPPRIVKALAALNRAPSNFPPVLARWLLDEFAPEGALVYDPCAGFGGRLLGTLASKKNLRYSGADIEPRTVRANLKLAESMGARDRVEMKQQAVEDSVPWPTCDIVLTSPPYFDRENYGGHAQNALKQYKTYALWRDGFLRDLISKSLEASPLVILNVAQLKKGKVVLDLPGDVMTLVAEQGGEIRRVLTWELSSFGKNKRQEQIIVFGRKSG